MRENGMLAAKYTYDKLGRIVREDNKKLGKTMLWSYDNFGNILSKRETVFTLKPTDEIADFTDEKKYFYDGDRLLSYGDEVILYADENGNDRTNPSEYRGKAAKWNYGRQLKSLGDMNFTYDGYGRRLTKNNTVFAYDANNKLVKQSDGTNTLEFVYDNSGVCGVKHNGTDYLFGKDIQGNVISVLDTTGREVVQYFYDAWGNCKINVLDKSCESIAMLNPFRYRGYYYDTETNLYYLNTRYYDPEVGRFISQDDVSYLDPEHVNGLNLFVYCGNNPVMMTDEDGTMPKWLRILLGIFVIVAAVVVSVATAGLAAPISTALGGGLAGSIIGGAVAGAIGGAIASFGISVGMQGIEKGFDNIDWHEVGIQTAIGAAIGAAVGGTLGGLKFGRFASKANLNKHFIKHGGEFGITDVKEYARTARYVIKNGTKITYQYNGHTTIGYIRFFGSGGHANYAFVGMNGSKIATFSVRSVSSLIKMGIPMFL